MKVKKTPVKQREENASSGNRWGITKEMDVDAFGHWEITNSQLRTGSVSRQGSVDLDDIVPLINRPDPIVLHVEG